MARIQLEQAEQDAYLASQKNTTPKLEQLKDELRHFKVKKIELSLARNKYNRAIEQFPSEASSFSDLLSQKQIY